MDVLYSFGNNAGVSETDHNRINELKYSQFHDY